MAQVAAVRFANNYKVLWFDPNGVEFVKGDPLIVQTERGLEYGVADENLKEVTEEQISKLNCELKPVIRVATEEDDQQQAEMLRLGKEAMPFFRQEVEAENLKMRPISVEYLFEGDRAVFYFESDERIDFRELVRVLASNFHIRIDMRQIGVRDEARIIGGYGHCGQELCCKRMGGPFNPVSIRMAKDQDLSLNPTKISGVCGRLMCCLRYEADTYHEFKKKTPKVGSFIKNEGGDLKVIEINVPLETITVMRDDKRLHIPVDRFEKDPETGKPVSIETSVLQEFLNPSPSTLMSAESLVAPVFSGTDKLDTNPKARRRGGKQPSKEETAAAEDTRRSRRRTHNANGVVSQPSENSKEGEASGKSKESSKGTGRSGRRRRDHGAGDGSKKQDQQGSTSSAKQEQSSTGADKGQSSKKNGKGKRQEQRPKATAKNKPTPRNAEGAKRPGQKSSGLASSKKGAEGAQAQAPVAEGASAGRKRRNRTHVSGGTNQEQ